MRTNRARMERIARRLNERAPELHIVQIVWHDELTGEEELAGELVLDGQQTRTIQLRWPEDEDGERARQDAPGRA